MFSTNASIKIAMYLIDIFEHHGVGLVFAFGKEVYIIFLYLFAFIKVVDSGVRIWSSECVYGVYIFLVVV